MKARLSFLVAVAAALGVAGSASAASWVSAAKPASVRGWDYYNVAPHALKGWQPEALRTHGAKAWQPETIKGWSPEDALIGGASHRLARPSGSTQRDYT